MSISRRYNRRKMGKAMRAAATALPPFNLAALNAEPFFDPYHSLLTVEEFEKFLTLVGQNRASRESRYYVSSGDGKLGCERGRNLRTHTQRSRDADLSKMEIMLVEDVDTRCLMALDANYHLDPQFVLAYADVGDKHSPDLDATADPTDMAGKWYVTEMSMSLDFPWQVGDSRAVKKFSTMDEPWYTNLFRGRHTAGTWLVNPWWGESVREEFDYANTKVRSKIACYCLTDKLRLVLVESFPRIVPFSRLSADHKKIRPFETHFHLPIPLKHWEQEPFSFFHVLDKMLRQFDF